MITLTLLHPGKTTAVQHWTFNTESTIRIGRSLDNEVVLYSAVVSRHHLEIRLNGLDWEVINLGTNGTYLDGQPIKTVPVVDGMIVSLASSGPKIQIHLSSEISSINQQFKPLTESVSNSPSNQEIDWSKKTHQETWH